MLTLEQIVQRAAKEARGDSRVMVGSGIAEKVRGYLSERVRVVPNGNGTKNVDIVFASVADVCESDGMARKPRTNFRPAGGNSNGRVLVAKRTIVLVPTTTAGGADIEKLSRWATEVVKNREELRVITDLAVIDLTADGLVVREVAPGVSARDVQQVTSTALLAGPDLSEVRI